MNWNKKIKWIKTEHLIDNTKRETKNCELNAIKGNQTWDKDILPK